MARMSAAVLIALAALLVKLGFCGAGLALIESVSAKLRIFRAPGVPGHGLSDRSARVAGSPSAGSIRRLLKSPLDVELLKLLAASYAADFVCDVVARGASSN